MDASLGVARLVRLRARGLQRGLLACKLGPQPPHALGCGSCGGCRRRRGGLGRSCELGHAAVQGAELLVLAPTRVSRGLGFLGKSEQCTCICIWIMAWCQKRGRYIPEHPIQA